MKKAHFYNTLSQFPIIFRFPFIASRISGLKTLSFLLLLVMSFWNGKLVGQTTWYVNDNSLTGDVYTSAVGNDANAGTAAAPFLTIAKAVTSAVDGDIIKVDAGSYNPNALVISKTLLFEGTNAGIHPAVGTHPSATVGTRNAESQFNRNGITFRLNADNIKFDGFEFIGTGGRIIDVLSTQSAKGFHLTNSIITDATSASGVGKIQFASAGNNDNLLFDYNLFNDGTNHTIYLGGNGSYNNVTLQYNLFKSKTNSFFWANSTALTGGIIDHNEFDGVAGTKNNNINIGQAGNLQISSNWFHGINYTAIQCGIVNGSITSNIFENYTGAPGSAQIQLWGGEWGTAVSSNVTIENNEFKYNNDAANPVTAIRLRGTGAIDGTTIHVHDNSFLDGGVHSGAYAVLHQGDQTKSVDATCNWYATISTPLVYDAPSLSGPVTFMPLLTTGTDNDSGLFGFQPVPNSCSCPGGTVTNTTTLKTFCTIQAAIDDAQTLAGHTITVSAGTYNEEITVNKRLTIIGAGSGSNPSTNTVIQGSTLNVPVVKIRTGGLSVSDRATIKDVYVTTNASNTISWIGGIEIDASNNNPLGHITLENVTVANCLGKTTGVHFKGVSATGVSTDIISDVKIINSLITNNQYGISARHTQVHGLEILGGSGRTVISENRRAGMLIYGVDNGSGFSNQFDDFVLNKVDFNHNNTSGDLDAGNGDIFFLGFNGDLDVDDVVITMGNTAVASPYYIGFGINGKYLGGTEPAGNMTFKNMQLNDYSGAQQHPRALMGIWTFSNLNAGVELDGVEFNGTGASQGALSLSGLYGTTPLVIKNSKFAGLSSYVVAPANQITDIRSVGSYVPVDATNNNTFTGTSDNYDIEDRIIHKIDNASYGLVTWVATNRYVTPNSYLPNITTTPDVQRGVGAASNGDIVHIEAGAYTGNVDATAKTVTLSPGASPACVTINGNVSLNGGDVMYIEADNTTACTGYDQFIVNGSVSLGGATLDLTLGYTPALGDSYTIINNDGADAVVGQFAQGAAITVLGYTFSINYAGGDGNDVVLTRCSGGVQNTNTGETFCTIQSAIDDAQTLGGHTITVSAGTYNEDVNVTKSVTISGADASTTIVSGPKGGGNATFRVSASGVIIENFTITRDGNNTTDWNDPTLNSAGVAIQSQGNTATIRYNIITGNRTGIDVNNANGNTITENQIDFNRTGLLFRNQTDNTTMTNNFIRDNWTVGVLFIDASGGSNSPLQQALNSNFNDNNISGNWYGDIVDRQNGGSLPPPGSNMKNFECNWYGVTSPVVSTVNPKLRLISCLIFKKSGTDAYCVVFFIYI
jgi:uncharacterized protein (DUF2345 family)